MRRLVSPDDPLAGSLTLEGHQVSELKRRAKSMLSEGFDRTLRDAVTATFWTTPGRHTPRSVIHIPQNYCCKTAAPCRSPSCPCLSGRVPEKPREVISPPTASASNPPVAAAAVAGGCGTVQRSAVAPADPMLAALLPERFDTALRSPCWRSNAGAMQCLPAFQIIGVSKCGTTDLFDRLRHHPDVSPATNKGPHWWDEDARGNASYYVGLFAAAAGAVVKDGVGSRLLTGEASSNTFTASAVLVRGKRHTRDLPLVPSLLSAAIPCGRYICIIREPIARYESAYFYYQRHNPQFKSVPYLSSPEGFGDAAGRHLGIFTRCLSSVRQAASPELPAAYQWAEPARRCSRSEYHSPAQQLIKGLYALWWHDWDAAANGAHARPLYVISEEYYSNCTAVMFSVMRHLGLSRPAGGEGWWTKMCDTTKKSNARSPAFSAFRMLPETRQKLSEFYAPYNVMMARLTGRDRLWGG
eukprot:TRINITY_DN4626_c1_g1_i4.p1 TRINITY_DN4626_c1_g1~~TRINITY_DN4626_c1_g1_i4.p1  ORF type:complete len:469 (+),score=64.56 TRINITY_DN4626_c1_g1_i4:1362-2768(+)